MLTISVLYPRLPSSTFVASKRPGDKERTPDEIKTLDHVDLSLSLEPHLTPADLEAEVARLSHTLAQQTDKPIPFHLCRRGALHRMLGRLNLALDDLNAVGPSAWNPTPHCPLSSLLHFTGSNNFIRVRVHI